MTITQQIITIGLCVLGTMATRFLPFIIFNEHHETPDFVQYLGKYLPSAVFGMLVISIAGGTICYMLLMQFVF